MSVSALLAIGDEGIQEAILGDHERGDAPASMIWSATSVSPAV
jgi:hypothetical protein